MSGLEDALPAQKAHKDIEGCQDGEIGVLESRKDNISIHRVQMFEFKTESHSANPVALGENSGSGSQRNDTEAFAVEDGEGSQPKRGFRFWCIMLALAATSVLSALEGTIVSTALPTIVEHLGGAELYIWTINGYFLNR
jgi:hypothetical protein